MDEDLETGGWRRAQPRADERSGPPESRPQIEELRSGEWVTKPAVQGRARRQDPPVSNVVRS